MENCQSYNSAKLKMETKTGHPTNPRSNIMKIGIYDPDKYVISKTSPSVTIDEALIPGCPPQLTQRSIGMYLKPTTRELDEVGPRPTIDELPQSVINKMLEKDKAFWVDKPGANAYELTDAYHRCGMTTEKVYPHHQDVFPRSYQYELECVKYRRQHMCDAMKDGNAKKLLPPDCRDCESKSKKPAMTAAQRAMMAEEDTIRRWRYYPDLRKRLTSNELRAGMTTVGRPFMHEACIWYYDNYPSAKFDLILRKFSK